MLQEEEKCIIKADASATGQELSNCGKQLRRSCSIKSGMFEEIAPLSKERKKCNTLNLQKRTAGAPKRWQSFFCVYTEGGAAGLLHTNSQMFLHPVLYASVNNVHFPF